MVDVVSGGDEEYCVGVTASSSLVHMSIVTSHQVRLNCEGKAHVLILSSRYLLLKTVAASVLAACMFMSAVGAVSCRSNINS